MKKLAATAVLSAVLLTGCSGAPSASEPTVTVTATTTVTASAAPTTAAPKTTPKASPTPAPVKTSGSYGADLAAAGVVPDDVADYGKFMAKYLCDSPMTGFSSFSDQVNQFGEPGGESGGRGPAVVRLTVAYFCPARAAEAEKSLAYHGYL